MSDPIRELEHTHGQLTKLLLDIGRRIRKSPAAGRSAEAEGQLVARLETLRDELLHHFADEEEGLFPFIRAKVPARAAVIDELESGHDAICGSVVRLAHLASRERPHAGPLLALYERFEETYSAHSRREADLLQELGRTLGAKERAELAELLRGL